MGDKFFCRYQLNIDRCLLAVTRGHHSEFVIFPFCVGFKVMRSCSCSGSGLCS
jgi:hypothetical protein